MRRILVAIVAAPVLLGIYAAALVSGSGHRRMMVRGLALFLVLAVGVFGVLRFTAAPASAGKPAAPDPSAVAGAAQPVVTNFNPNQAVRLDFSVPMDRVSVQNALSVEPPTATTLTWSETGTSVNVVPGGAWEPGTFYTVTVGTAARSEVGQPLARPLHAVILTRSAPTAKIAATRTADGRALATTGFTVSFDRPVDVESVRAAFKIAPAVKGTLQVAGKGATAHRFTFVPLRPLVPDTTYTVTLAGPVVDADDIEVAAAPRLQVRTVAKVGTPTKTASAPAAVSVAAEEPAAEATPTPVTTPDETPGATPAAPSAEATASPGPSATPAPTPSPAAEVILMAPAVVRFRPLNGAADVSTSQAVSVRFTQPMDHASTQAAFKLSGYDMKKGGEFYWAEGDTVLVFEPAKPLAYGTKYTLTVGGGAKAKTGAMITVPSNKKAIVSTFKVAAKPKPLPVPPKPGRSRRSPRHGRSSRPSRRPGSTSSSTRSSSSTATARAGRSSQTGAARDTAAGSSAPTARRSGSMRRSRTASPVRTRSTRPSVARATTSSTATPGIAWRGPGTAAPTGPRTSAAGLRACASRSSVRLSSSRPSSTRATAATGST